MFADTQNALDSENDTFLFSRWPWFFSSEVYICVSFSEFVMSNQTNPIQNILLKMSSQCPLSLSLMSGKD